MQPIKMPTFAIMIDGVYKYSSISLAYYIVAVFNEKNLEINMTKLQKLLYIVYGTYLSLFNKRLINEHPQAWPYGPVFPLTRNALLNKDLSAISPSIINKDKMECDDDLKSVMEIIIRTFGKYNATSLVKWSHQPGSPWDRVVNRDGFSWGAQIPDEYIKEYFDSIIIRKP